MGAGWIGTAQALTFPVLLLSGVLWWIQRNHERLRRRMTMDDGPKPVPTPTPTPTPTQTEPVKP